MSEFCFDPCLLSRILLLNCNSAHTHTHVHTLVRARTHMLTQSHIQTNNHTLTSRCVTGLCWLGIYAFPSDSDHGSLLRVQSNLNDSHTCATMSGGSGLITVQFQFPFKLTLSCSERPIHAQTCLSAVSPRWPLKEYQHLSS